MINDANALNEQSPRVPVHFSNFPQERHVLGTYRFGEYAPFFYFDGVGSDDVSQRSVTTTRSMSLSAPLMEDIKMKRDYFVVPYQALLPHNWQKVLVTPKHGDDVISTQVGPFVKNFAYKVASTFSAFLPAAIDALNVAESSSAQAAAILAIFRSLAFGELFFSNGCLLATLGVHLADGVRFSFTDAVNGDTYTRVSLDRFFDWFCSTVLDGVSPDLPDAIAFRYTFGSGSSSLSDVPYIVKDAKSMRIFLSRLREGDVREIFAVNDQVLSQLIDALSGLSLTIYNYFTESSNVDVSLARPASYQICCAHYFTNDNIDYIYSADLWRDYLGSLICGYDSSYRSSSFVYNGVSYPYDWLSAFYFDQILADSSSDISELSSIYPYFYAIFGFHRSLRFVDYFAGARTQPLAVGDTDIAVVDNKVSVIDVTRRIQWQRLLNNVLRIPSQIEEYMKGMFPGAQPKYDYHNPAWLAHTTDIVFTAEVENTGAAQVSDPNSITATFRGNSSDKQFDIKLDYPCVIIGIQYFDIRRAYYTGVDRLVQHTNRFEMFMPELQYLGDQEIRGSELLSYLGDVPISYTTRNMEYKQVIDQAFGGFVENLPGWAFLWNPDDWRITGPDYGELQARISPDFIRSLPTELDDYFIKLSGFSYGSYWHFQQKIVNITEARRPMVKEPQILG